MGDWPGKLYQSPVTQVFQGFGQAFMAAVVSAGPGQGNKSPAILRPAQPVNYIYLHVSGYRNVDEGLDRLVANKLGIKRDSFVAFQ